MKQYAKIGLKIVQIITQSLSRSNKQAQKRRWFARKDLIFLLFLVILSIAAFLTPPSNDLASSNAIASIGGIGEKPALPADQVRTIVPYELLVVTDKAFTSEQPQVRALWLIGVVIVDVFIVLLFIFHGLRIMLSGSVFSYASASEAIGRILLSVVVAHVSLEIIGYFIGASNAISTGLAQTSFALQTTRMPQNVTLASVIADLTITNANPTNIINNALNLIVGSTGNIAVDIFNLYMASLPRAMLKLVALVLIWAFIAQLLIRLLLIDLFIAISAPCIAASALPGRSGQPITGFWLHGIVSTVLVQVLQVGGLIVSQILFDTLFNILDARLPDLFVGGLLPYILYIAILWFLLRLPSLLRTSTTQMIQSGGQAVVTAAGSAASTAITAATTAVSAAGVVAIVAR